MRVNVYFIFSGILLLPLFRGACQVSLEPALPPDEYHQDELVFLDSKKKEEPKPQAPFSKNGIIKLNLASLMVRNISLQYERPLKKHFSFAISASYMLPGDIPFRTSIESIYSVKATETIKGLANTNLSGFSITPEFRWYPLNKNAPSGLYLAPYVSYGYYSVKTSYSYSFSTDTTKILNLAGNATNYSLGLIAGYQLVAYKSLYLDLWLGAQYGKFYGDLKSSEPINYDERRAIASQMEGLEMPVKNTYTIEPSGVSAALDGFLAGFRSGISVGFRF